MQKYGLKWGGSFSRPDEMHFEISLDEAGCATLIEKLKLAKAG